MSIENLSFEELIELNSKIVKRLRELNKIEKHKELQRFEVGDSVYFINNGKTITGTVIRINQRTLSIKTAQGMWYVAPRAVKKILSQEKSQYDAFHPISLDRLNN